MALILYFPLWVVASALWRIKKFRRPELRLLSPFPGISVSKHGIRPKRINQLLARLGPRASYLEVGVSKGFTFQEVRAFKKVGVEPKPQFNTSLLPPHTEIHIQTSDSFFASALDGLFDLIFLDGLHEANQTYRDLCSAIPRLKNGGYIVIDDILPKNIESSLPDEQASIASRIQRGMPDRAWYGDTYKVIALIYKAHPELDVQIVGNSSYDHGQAVLSFANADRKLSFVPYPAAREYFASINFFDVFGKGRRPKWSSRR